MTDEPPHDKTDKMASAQSTEHTVKTLISPDWADAVSTCMLVLSRGGSGSLTVPVNSTVKWDTQFIIILDILCRLFGDGRQVLFSFCGAYQPGNKKGKIYLCPSMN